MIDLFMRERSVKKHTRSVKETLMIYTMGVVICAYLGFLFGAVWIDGNDLNEFMNNFQSFIIEQHHFIVGVTAATPTFVLSFAPRLSIRLPVRNLAMQSGEMQRSLRSFLQIMMRKIWWK